MTTGATRRVFTIMVGACLTVAGSALVGGTGASAAGACPVGAVQDFNYRGADTCTQIFDYSGALVDFTVPPGVTQLTTYMQGGLGFTPPWQWPFLDPKATGIVFSLTMASFPVIGGQRLTLAVGGNAHQSSHPVFGVVVPGGWPNGGSACGGAEGGSGGSFIFDTATGAPLIAAAGYGGDGNLIGTGNLGTLDGPGIGAGLPGAISWTFPKVPGTTASSIPASLATVTHGGGQGGPGACVTSAPELGLTREYDPGGGGGGYYGGGSGGVFLLTPKPPPPGYNPSISVGGGGGGAGAILIGTPAHYDPFEYIGPINPPAHPHDGVIALTWTIPSDVSPSPTPTSSPSTSAASSTAASTSAAPSSPYSTPRPSPTPTANPSVSSSAGSPLAATGTPDVGRQLLLGGSLLSVGACLVGAARRRRRTQ